MKYNPDIVKDILVKTISSMNDEQLEKFVKSPKIDLRGWYKVKINGEEVPWWASEGELDEVTHRYTNVEFEPISFAESWTY
jgi:hypothetical protein